MYTEEMVTPAALESGGAAQGKVLSVASPKGGVGKTTLALNLSYALAHRGWNTLLVDADPQGCIGLSIDGGGR